MRCGLLLCVGFAAFCFSSSVRANSEWLSAQDPRFQIGLDTWISTGESSWEISFVEFEPGFGFVEGRSRLEWESLDSVVLRLHGEYRILDWLRVNAAYGFGDIDDGKNTDTDWFVFDDGQTFVFSESVADTSGDLTIFDMNVILRLNSWIRLPPDRFMLDVVLGYQYYEEDLVDRNGVQTLWDGQRINQPFAGLDSTFRFEWSAFRLGLRGSAPVANRLRIRSELTALLGVKFKGEAFWNLREDFRDESPNFVQDASNGTGAEAKVALAFDFTRNFFGEVGLWWFHMKARNGTDTIYFADGSTANTNLDWVKTTRYGLFLGAGGRF